MGVIQKVTKSDGRRGGYFLFSNPQVTTLVENPNNVLWSVDPQNFLAMHTAKDSNPAGSANPNFDAFVRIYMIIATCPGVIKIQLSIIRV